MIIMGIKFISTIFQIPIYYKYQLFAVTAQTSTIQHKILEF
jgi:hypothetical protein